MSKLNLIQEKIKQINSSRFQELCDSYLYRKGYKNIKPFGSMIGKEKSIKGTPDSFIRLPNGNYIFIEHTTKERDLFKKIKGDLEACFNEKKTGIPNSKIEKIIVCHNSRLDAGKEEELAEICAEHGSSFEAIGIGTLSIAISEDYQGLAKEFLDIEIDTRQILTIEEFIGEYQKNALANKLDTKFQFREEEIEKAIDALEKKDIVIVTGSAGVGKSRLAIESCRKFKKKNPRFKTYCIFNKSLQIYSDLKTYFSPQNDYLILVDDANRLTELDHILRLLNEDGKDRQVKVILTVRDYALNKIKKNTNKYSSKEFISLKPFDNKQIKEFISQEFEIKNHRYLNRIKEIAKGNPRLAVMAAQVAEKEQNFKSIVDATDLYNKYFASIDNELNEPKNENLLKVAGILSFFSVLNRTQKEKFSEIAKRFDIDKDELWEAVKCLHKLEIVDLYEDDIAKISDQVLSTYLFYKAFLGDKLLDFYILLKHYSESYKFNDAVFGAFNAFNNEEIRSFLQKNVNRRWKEVKSDELKLLNLAGQFWFLKKTEILLYLKQQIDDLPRKKFNLQNLSFEPSKNSVTDKYLKVLKNFQHAKPEDFDIALELIFSYVKNNPSILPQVMYLVLEVFRFQVDSYNYGYYIQKTLINHLVKRANSKQKENLYQKILLTISDKYLKTYFHSGWMETRQTYSYTNFGLIACPEIFEIRMSILQFLTNEFEKTKCEKTKDTVLQIVVDYSQNIYEKHLKEEVTLIATEDAKIIIPFIIKNLSSKSYKDCVVAQMYFNFLEKRKVKFDKLLKNKFVNETYRISKVLIPNRVEFYGLIKKDRDKYKRRVISKFFAKYKLRDYKKFFESCVQIAQYNKDFNSNLFQSVIGMVFSNLFENNQKLFKKVFVSLIASGNELGLIIPSVTQDLFLIYKNPINIYKLLQKYDYKTKTAWVFSFFAELESNKVNDYYLNELYNLYKTTNLGEVILRFNELKSFTKLDARLIPNIIKILFERSEQEKLNISFSMLFYFDNNYQKLTELFKEDWDLFKQIYLYEILRSTSLDYRGEILKEVVKIEPTFINTYLENLYKINEYLSNLDSSQRYSALWEMKEYKTVLENALEFIYQKEKPKLFVLESYANVFFTYEAKNGEVNEEDITIKKYTFVESYIENYYFDSNRMKFIFNIVVNSFPSQRYKFLEIFLKYNKNYTDFEKINIEPRSWGGIGSMVPVLEKKVEFLESLLPLFKHIDFLKHKVRIKEEILRWKNRIDEEIRSEFIGDF